MQNDPDNVFASIQQDIHTLETKIQHKQYHECQDLLHHFSCGMLNNDSFKFCETMMKHHFAKTIELLIDETKLIDETIGDKDNANLALVSMKKCENYNHSQIEYPKLHAICHSGKKLLRIATFHITFVCCLVIREAIAQNRLNNKSLDTSIYISDANLDHLLKCVFKIFLSTVRYSTINFNQGAMEIFVASMDGKSPGNPFSSIGYGPKYTYVHIGPPCDDPFPKHLFYDTKKHFLLDILKAKNIGNASHAKILFNFLNLTNAKTSTKQKNEIVEKLMDNILNSWSNINVADLMPVEEAKQNGNIHSLQIQFELLYELVRCMNDKQILSCITCSNFFAHVRKMIDKIIQLYEKARIDSYISQSKHISNSPDAILYGRTIIWLLLELIIKLCEIDNSKYRQIIVHNIIKSNIFDGLLRWSYYGLSVRYFVGTLVCQIALTFFDIDKLLLANHLLYETKYLSCLFHMIDNIFASDYMQETVLLNSTSDYLMFIAIVIKQLSNLVNIQSQNLKRLSKILNKLSQDTKIEHVLKSLAMYRFSKPEHSDGVLSTLLNRFCENHNQDHCNHISWVIPHSCGNFRSKNTVSNLLCLNPRATIIVESFIEFAQIRYHPFYIRHCDLIGKCCFLGFMSTGFTRGQFTVLQFISYMFSNDHGYFNPINTKCKRNIRVSMAKMAEKLDVQDKTLPSDHEYFSDNYKYWSHLMSIALGMYSFYFINFTLNSKSEAKLQNKEKFKSYNNIANYLTKFVISYIEPHLKELTLSANDIYLKKSHCILAICYAFMANFKKYNQYCLFIQDICFNNEIVYQLLIILQQAKMIWRGNYNNFDKLIKSQVITNNHNIMLGSFKSLVCLINRNSRYNFNHGNIGKTQAIRLHQQISSANVQLYKNWIKNIIDEETRDEEKFSSWKELVSPIRQCHNCGCQSVPSFRVRNLKRCKRCRKALYCSKECQKKHWFNGHSKICKKL